MAIFATPVLDREAFELIERADDLRAQLHRAITAPGNWVARIRRQAEAQAYSSSTTIEGFAISSERAEAIAGGAAASKEDNEQAFSAYLDAMRLVGALASDHEFAWNRQVLFALHFTICRFQPHVKPGELREGQIFVTGDGGRIAYTGPDGDRVSDLVDEAVGWLHEESDDSHLLVRAAMTHLNLVSIHPFRDGNGRFARVAQSLALAEHSDLPPEFGSIEPYLAASTSSYYGILESVQGGSYDPIRDALPWVKFCLEAHIEQARSRIDMLAAAATRWSALEDLATHRGWPERIVIAMEQAMTVGTDRSSYVNEAEVSEPTASIDLRRLVDAGLITPAGAGRSTRYHATDELKRIL